MEEKNEATFTCKSVDMPEELEAAATAEIIEVSEEFTLESEVAAKIKKHMDTRYGEAWHCIVGSSFGSFVSHSSGYFIYGDLENKGIKKSVLLFKTD